MAVYVRRGECNLTRSALPTGQEIQLTPRDGLDAVEQKECRVFLYGPVNLLAVYRPRYSGIYEVLYCIGFSSTSCSNATSLYEAHYGNLLLYLLCARQISAHFNQ
jgi:hypothetical protein